VKSVRNLPVLSALPAPRRPEQAAPAQPEQAAPAQPEQAAPAQPEQAVPAQPARLPRGPAWLRHPVTGHLALLCGYLAAGVAVTWPRASYLTGHKLPATRDAGAYVWCFWWMAHQVSQLASPWFTKALAAPVGAQLGLHVLMPLEGVLLMPVTLLFGPSASYNLLSAAIPGLLCYAAYRVARLWLPSLAGAVAAGAFFGLSPMLTWRSWYHLNLAVGALFLPLAVEAAVRLRRQPSTGRGVILGLALAGSLLTDQESTVLAVILVALVLLPWLVRRPGWGKLKAAALAAGVSAVAGGPQIAAVASQVAAGNAVTSPYLLGNSYIRYGLQLTGLFAPSPRLAGYGLDRLAAGYYHDGVIYQTVAHRYLPTSEGTPMFGLVLTVLAVVGLAVSWRRRGAWQLALLWAASAALALGPVLWIAGHRYLPAARTLDGVRVSALLPYTWFVQIPGFSGFREAGRLAELGLLPAALLAGAAVAWLRARAWPALAVVAVAAALEAGWTGGLPTSVMPVTYRVGVMPTAMPALDHPIAADHSGSIVVDYPFGIGGGIPTYGAQFAPEAQVLATADGHPRAVAFVARVPAATIAGVKRHPFYADLVKVWQGASWKSPAQWAAARLDAQRMNVGWVLVWPQWHTYRGKLVRASNPGVDEYLARAGFRFAYQADGVQVYRRLQISRR
jgi:hypothetical protein